MDREYPHQLASSQRLRPTALHLRVPPVKPFATVEIGGTKTDVAIGTSIEDISSPHRITTTTPEETIDEITDYLSQQELSAVGVASFGPLDLNPASASFGSMLATPKPNWSGTRLYDLIQSAIGVPIHLDTDVNGAALGEGTWGAARGMANYAYVTVGTGVGVGVITQGEPIRGERHPEGGHVMVARIEDDRFEGTCPYHGDCLEGMASGPALEARFGAPETWRGNDTVLRYGAGYVAQGLLNITYTLAPERIIVGGGVSALPGFHARLRDQLQELLSGYPAEFDLDLLVSKPGLGSLSGLAGGLVLAKSVAH